MIRRRLAALAAATITIALAAGPLAAQQVPPAPNPVAVSVAPATTALFVLDVIDPICNPQPTCLAMVPHVAALLAAARKAGAFVLYSAADPDASVTPMHNPPFLAAVAPIKGDPIVIGAGQDRFYATNVDGMLRAHGITTLILAGWREDGSVLYTAIGATLRGYTVVVADDAVSATRDYDVAVGRYQMLTQLHGNPKNEPLLKGAVTLSRSDLITFR
jgi:nicotinamidase-related amidase